jgi:hypothetical protein
VEAGHDQNNSFRVRRTDATTTTTKKSKNPPPTGEKGIMRFHNGVIIITGITEMSLWVLRSHKHTQTQQLHTHRLERQSIPIALGKEYDGENTNSRRLGHIRTFQIPTGKDTGSKSFDRILAGLKNQEIS